MMVCVVNSSFTDTPLITNTLLFCLKHLTIMKDPKNKCEFYFPETLKEAQAKTQLPFSLEASYQVLYLPT